MTRPPLATHLVKWSLIADGSPVETPSSWLMLVRRGGVLAMLKVFKPASDARRGPVPRVLTLEDQFALLFARTQEHPLLTSCAAVAHLPQRCMELLDPLVD